MNREETAMRLAGRLSDLTLEGKLTWVNGGRVGPWGTWPGQVFKASVDDGTFAQIAEIPVPNSSITSYYFGVAEGGPEIFELNVQDRSNEIVGIFAEGYPAEPTKERLKLLEILRDLYAVARDNAKGTRQKVERLEQRLERLA